MSKNSLLVRSMLAVAALAAVLAAGGCDAAADLLRFVTPLLL